MRWFKSILSKRSAPSRTENEDTTELIDLHTNGERFVRIPSRNFFGQFCRSPNGRFVLAWRDGNDAGTRGGSRSEGPGRFLLFQDGRLLTEGRAERPNDGRVANDGRFILNDWLFGPGLQGVFRAFHPSGALLLERRFSANLFNNGLSPDGRMAVCQTCHAKGTDNSLLVVFDLDGEREFASWVPETGWASTYRFSEDHQTVGLVYSDGDVCHYSLTGELLNRAEWLEAQYRGDNLHMLYNLVQDAGDGLTADDAAKILESIAATLAAPKFDERQRPLALKIRGLCQEALNAFGDAFESYQQALALDPKIGVARKAAQIRKRMDSAGR